MKLLTGRTVQLNVMKNFTIRMVLSILENGSWGLDMDMELWSGLMALSMKGTGPTAGRLVLENLYILMEMLIMGNGLATGFPQKKLLDAVAI